MKKYLFGILAIVLAIGFSAFKKPNAVHTFVFDSSKGSIFSQADVDNVAKWTDADYLVENCEATSEFDDRACTIEVDDDYYELVPDGEGELRLKTSGTVMNLIVTNGKASGLNFYQIVDELATEAAYSPGIIEVKNTDLP